MTSLPVNKLLRSTLRKRTEGQMVVVAIRLNRDNKLSPEHLKRVKYLLGESMKENSFVSQLHFHYNPINNGNAHSDMLESIL